MLGTLINAGTVLVGSCLGLAIHRRLPRRIAAIAFQGIGLFTLFLGFTMAFLGFTTTPAAKKGAFMVIMVFSIVPGSIIGELLDIEKRMNGFAEFVKGKVKSGDERFSEGLITAFLLFCMGSMTILGAIEEGLGRGSNLLITKAVLDGFSSLALAASLGIGVIFSVIPLVLYQGGITIFASSLRPLFTDVLVNEMTAVGGLLIIGLGISILEIKKLPILNMLPSLVIAVLLAWFFL